MNLIVQILVGALTGWLTGKVVRGRGSRKRRQKRPCFGHDLWDHRCPDREASVFLDRYRQGQHHE